MGQRNIGNCGWMWLPDCSIWNCPGVRDCILSVKMDGDCDYIGYIWHLLGVERNLPFCAGDTGQMQEETGITHIYIPAVTGEHIWKMYAAYHCILAGTDGNYLYGVWNFRVRITGTQI